MAPLSDLLRLSWATTSLVLVVLVVVVGGVVVFVADVVVLVVLIVVVMGGGVGCGVGNAITNGVVVVVFATNFWAGFFFVLTLMNFLGS